MGKQVMLENESGKNIGDLIDGGENSFVEFKEDVISPIDYHIDDRPIIGSSLKDIHTEKGSIYFKNNYEIEWQNLNNKERENLMLNSCILAEFDSKLFATIPGLLFFAGKRNVPFDPLERYLPNAGIQFVSYKNEEMDEILDKYFCFETSPELVDIIVQKIKINWKTPF